MNGSSVDVEPRGPSVLHPSEASDTLERAQDHGRAAPNVVERAAAILREEVADGALANIAQSSRLWSEQRPSLIGKEVSRRLRADFAGLLDPVLELLAPAGSTSNPQRVTPIGSGVAPDPQPSPEAIPILRARYSVAPGGAAEIRTSLRNDGPHSVDIAFLCSDLVAKPGDHILASCVQLQPRRVRLAPGEVVGLVIGLTVPADARRGVYHAVLQAIDLTGLRALVTFPVA